jgi:hypothetical protein
MDDFKERLKTWAKWIDVDIALVMSYKPVSAFLFNKLRSCRNVSFHCFSVAVG